MTIHDEVTYVVQAYYTNDWHDNGWRTTREAAEEHLSALRGDYSFLRFRLIRRRVLTQVTTTEEILEDEE